MGSENENNNKNLKDRIGENFKIFFKASFYYTSRLVLWGVLGFLYNFIFFLFSVAGILRLYRGLGDFAWGESLGSFVGGVLQALSPFGIVALCLVGFPFLWFLLGKGFGIVKAMSHLFHHKREVFLSYIHKIFCKVIEKVKITEGKKVKESFRKQAKLDNIPTGYKVLLSLAFEQINLVRLAGLMDREPEVESEAFRREFAEIVEEGIRENYLDTPWLWLGALLLINIAVQVAISLYLP